MTTIVSERRTLPAIVCQPWCEYQDGHADVIYRADQCCYSPDLRVDLTLHPVVADSYIDADGHSIPGHDHIEVNAQQTGDDRYAHIEIRRESDDAAPVSWKFTPAEAGQLVEALQLLLGQVSR